MMKVQSWISYNICMETYEHIVNNYISIQDKSFGNDRFSGIALVL